MRLTGNGVSAELPAGWEGAVTRQKEPGSGSLRQFADADGPQPVTLPALHLANVPLPPSRGDFGSEVVERLGNAGVFVSLLEYGAESVGTALFAVNGLPRKLRAGNFSPRMLQRTVPGQAGYQVFFTEAGRAFCLYVVLGAARKSSTLVGEANGVLATVAIGRR